MSTFPVDLNFLEEDNEQSRVYTHESFLGKGYVAAFPDFLTDASYTLETQNLGYCTMPRPFIPGYREITVTCSRQRSWLKGTTLLFRSIDTASYAVMAVTVISYDRLTGVLRGLIVHVALTYRLKKGSVWEIVPVRKGVYFHNNVGSMSIANGGLGASGCTQSMLARENLGLPSPYKSSLPVFDDFLGTTSDRWTVSDPAKLLTPSSGSLLQFARGVKQIDTGPAPHTMNLTALNDSFNFTVNMEYEARINVLALSDGVNRAVLRVGYSKLQTFLAADIAAFIEYDQAVSPNWRLGVCNGSTVNYTAGSVAVGAGWHRLRLTKDGVTLAMIVDGVVAATTVAGIPAASTRKVLHASKTLGAGTLSYFIDYVYARYSSNRT